MITELLIAAFLIFIVGPVAIGILIGIYQGVIEPLRARPFNPQDEADDIDDIA